MSPQQVHDAASDPPAGTAQGPPVPPHCPKPADADPAADKTHNPAAEAFGRITRDVNELKEYAGHYLAAKVDGIKQTIRRIVLYVALGVLGLIAGGAIVATAAGLLIVGLADLLGRLF